MNWREHLGKRWFPIPARVSRLPQIQKYWNDHKRFKLVHAGRRSYKTELAKRKLIIESLINPDQNLFFGAPTYTQAKDVAWEDLKNLTPKIFIKSISESGLRIKLKNNSEICVVGFDKPDRFEGRIRHGGVLDEFPNMKSQVWNQNIMPMLRDTGGWGWLLGVPEGRNHYFELMQQAKKDGEWGIYNWHSRSVMDPTEIAKEEARLDKRTFDQEYGGQFVSYEGRAYVYFDREKHIKNIPYNSYLPLCISADFNTDPCVWIYGQDNNGDIIVLGEIVQKNTDIWKMTIALKEKIKELNHKDKNIIFYGDLEHGNNRSVSATTTSWQIIKNEMADYIIEYRLKGHPKIIDRVNAVNSKLRSADGKIHLFINEDCSYLNKDLEMVSMEDLQKTRVIDKDLTHASDDLGYWTNYDYPILKMTGIQY